MFFSLNIHVYLKKSLVSIGLKSTEKDFTLPFNTVFFSILFIVKSLKCDLSNVYNRLFQSFLL